MIQYIIAILFFLIAISIMILSLHFSKYKKKPSGCCGGGHCKTGNDGETQAPSCFDEKIDFVDKYKANQTDHSLSPTVRR